MNELIELCKLSYRNRSWKRMGGKDWVCQKVRGRRGREGRGTPGWGELWLEACACLWGKNGLLCTLIIHMSASAWLERTAGLVSHQNQGHKIGDGEEQEEFLFIDTRILHVSKIDLIAK